MGYVVYARRFRPQKFEEVVGQDAAVSTLKNAVAQDKVAHAYLFAGPRGVGKTTTARILAKALNCEKGPTTDPCGVCGSCEAIVAGSDLDVIELDAASHNSVDDVRALREAAFHSTHRSRLKVYILDEVHMFSNSAFNALLKILEEPPRHVKFVLCTTDPQRVPETVRSRCQRIDFRRITAEDVAERLRQIVRSEGLSAPREALLEIARRSGGGMRDAEVLLEGLATYVGDREITPRDVRALTGASDDGALSTIITYLAAGKAAEALEEADRLLESGAEPVQLVDSMLEHIRCALVLRKCGKESPLVRGRFIPQAAEGTAGALEEEDLLYASAVLSACRRDAKSSPQPRIVLELCLFRLSRIRDLVRLEELAAELKGGAGGGGPLSGRVQNAGREAETPSPPRAHREPEAASEQADRAPSGPPPEPGGPPPPPPVGELTLEAVRERWGRALAAVRARSNVTAALLREASPSALSGERLVLELSPRFSFHRERLSEPGRKASIEEAVSEVLGRRMSVEIRPSGGGGGGPSGPADTRRSREEAVEDPVVKKVLDRFGGRVLSVGPEEEG